MSMGNGESNVDPMTCIVSLDVRIEEVHVNNCPTWCLNLLGYVYLISKFSEHTKRNYECKRFKNRWSHSKQTVGTVHDAIAASVVPWRLVFNKTAFLGGKPCNAFTTSFYLTCCQVPMTSYFCCNIYFTMLIISNRQGFQKYIISGCSSWTQFRSFPKIPNFYGLLLPL